MTAKRVRIQGSANQGAIQSFQIARNDSNIYAHWSRTTGTRITSSPTSEGSRPGVSALFVWKAADEPGYSHFSALRPMRLNLVITTKGGSNCST